jgi:hypothetical protein
MHDDINLKYISNIKPRGEQTRQMGAIKLGSSKTYYKEL